MCARMTIRRLEVHGALALCLVNALAGYAVAQGLPSSPPLPPPRPVFPGENVREQDGALPLQRETGRPSPRDKDQPLVQPSVSPPGTWVWPPTDRGALRACAIEWQRMSEDGRAADKTWGEFAPLCMMRQAKPAK
jgi:hypothetical protein